MLTTAAQCSKRAAPTLLKKEKKKKKKRDERPPKAAEAPPPSPPQPLEAATETTKALVEKSPKVAKAARTLADALAPKPTHDLCHATMWKKRVRDICFTAWDTSREPFFPEDANAFFIAYQLEQCPTTGKHHWQGVVCFRTVHVLERIRGLLGQPTAYVAQRVAPLSQCIAYCTKDESRAPGAEPVILGEPRIERVRGERSDLNVARELILQKRTWTEVVSEPKLCDVLARHVKWCHEVFENRQYAPVDEASSLGAFHAWQLEILSAIGCDRDGAVLAPPRDVALWFSTKDAKTMLHLYHLASFCQTNRGAYLFHAHSEAEGVAHKYQSQKLIICLAGGHTPSFQILAAMLAGTCPTGKFEGRQQLRQEPAFVAVFADHPPPPKLHGIVRVADLDGDGGDEDTQDDATL